MKDYSFPTAEEGQLLYWADRLELSPRFIAAWSQEYARRHGISANDCAEPRTAEPDSTPDEPERELGPQPDYSIVAVDQWLYRCRSASGELLYVGITGSGVRRLKQHGRGKSWWRFVARVDIEHFDDLESAERAELKVIRTEDPRYNRANRVRPPESGGVERNDENWGDE